MCEKLTQLLPEITTLNQSMSEKTTFGIGGKVKAYIEPRTKKELLKAIKILKKQDLKFKVIGNGSNLLFDSGDLDIVVVSTRNMKEKYSLHQTTLRVPSGALSSEVIMWCAKRGLSGLENLVMIPATIGGMVVMNAGAFSSQMSDVVSSVEVLDGDKIRIINASDLGFSYHHSNLIKSNLIVLSVEMNLKRLASSVIFSLIKENIRKRLESQPKGRSAGSVFSKTSDGISAGKLIDEAGLKGLKKGGAVISEKHANFILNEGGATSNDVLFLIKHIKNAIFKEFNVKLHEEIEIVGENDANNW